MHCLTGKLALHTYVLLIFEKSLLQSFLTVFLDFERAFDSIEWNFIHKCLETFNFGLDLRQWLKSSIQISLIAF